MDTPTPPVPSPPAAPAPDAPNPPPPPPDQQQLTRSDLISIITTAALFVILAFVAWLSYSNKWLLVLAFSVGGLGGVVHEIAQSRGKILFFQRQSDGLYLGTIAGIMLGGVAGMLTIRGYATGATPVAEANLVQISYEVFLAGLALKGVAEAAATGPTK